MSTLDWRENLDVLHTPYHKMFQNHMRRVGEEVVGRHSYPQTLEQWQEQRRGVRAGLLDSMGEMPQEPCDLDPQVVGILQRPGYVIEKVRIQTRPDWFIGLNLYRPTEQSEPLPGVFHPHGHWPHGKTQSHIQTRAVNFVRRGYVALNMDMVGYGEREFMGHQDQFPGLTVGLTLGGLLLYDNMRCLDYLCSRPEVNASLIGCTGSSGGGNQTTYLSALDERIKVSSPVCSVELYADYFTKGFCVCETIPRVVQYADQPHVLGLVAPRPLLLVNASLDHGFPILKANQALDGIKRIYRLYGREDAVALHEMYADHSYEEAARLGVYHWFDKWLKGVQSDDEREEPAWVEPDGADTLFVGGFDERMTVPHLTYLRVTEKLAAGKQPKDPAIARRNLAEPCLGGLPNPPEPLTGKSVETLWRGDHSVEKIAIRSERDIIVTGLLLKPEPAPEQMPVCISLYPPNLNGGSPKQSAVYRREVRQILDAGWAVFAVEPRGIGETRTDYVWEYELRQTIVLGRLIAGMQAFDVMRTADYVQQRPDLDGSRIALWGEGEMAFVALLASALDQRFTKTCLYKLLASYAHDAQIRQGTMHFLFDVIEKVGDICDIASLIAPRPLVVASPLDGSLHPACPQTYFKRTGDAYAAGSLILAASGYESMVEAWLKTLG